MNGDPRTVVVAGRARRGRKVRRIIFKLAGKIDGADNPAHAGRVLHQNGKHVRSLGLPSRRQIHVELLAPAGMGPHFFSIEIDRRVIVHVLKAQDAVRRLLVRQDRAKPGEADPALEHIDAGFDIRPAGPGSIEAGIGHPRSAGFGRRPTPFADSPFRSLHGNTRNLSAMKTPTGVHQYPLTRRIAERAARKHRQRKAPQQQS